MMFGQERGAPVIGHDILDIGSRKERLGITEREMLGRPGAFDVVPVADVSITHRYYLDCSMIC
jgi:hypothetical protein